MADNTENKSLNPRNLRPAGEPARGKQGKTMETKSEDQDLSGLGQTILRNEYYRDGYRTALRLSYVLGFVIVLLIGLMYFIVHVHQPENRYFATTEDGRMVPMVALSQPNLSNPALMSWVAQASTEVMTFGFNDYRRRLQEASRHFTEEGWKSFTNALKSARMLEAVETQTQVITAAPRGAPVLKAEGSINGQYQWQVQIPMVLTIQSGSKKRTDNWMVTLLVVRVSRLESPNGVGIAQWLAIPG